MRNKTRVGRQRPVAAVLGMKQKHFEELTRSEFGQYFEFKYGGCIADGSNMSRGATRELASLSWTC